VIRPLTVLLVLLVCGCRCGEPAALYEGQLKSPERAVRRRAVFALQTLPAPRGAIALRRQLQREADPGIRAAVLHALGTIAPAGAVDLLLQELDRPAGQRVAALEALAIAAKRIGPDVTPRLHATLRRVLRRDAVPLQRLAAMVLARAHGCAPLCTPERLLPGAPRGEAHSARMGGTDEARLVPLLRRCGTSPDDGLRRWATAALAPCGDLEWLAGRMSDARFEVRVAAARALGAAGPAGARRLARELQQQWREVSANHFRLTGSALHPVLVSLELLRRHAALPEVARVGREVLDLSDATDAAVTYGEKEAQAVDLVHCAAAQLVDLAQGRLQHTPGCGTAHSKRVTPAMHVAFEAEVVTALSHAPTGVLHSALQSSRHPRAPVQAAPSKPVPSKPVPGVKPPRRLKVVTRRGVFHVVLTRPGPVLPCGAATYGASRMPAYFVRGLGAMVVRRVVAGQRVELGPLEGRIAGPTAPCERGPTPAEEGSVGLLQDGGLQVMLERQPWLDGRFTPVGRVEPDELELLRSLQPGDPITGIYPLW